MYRAQYVKEINTRNGLAKYARKDQEMMHVKLLLLAFASTIEPVLTATPNSENVAVVSSAGQTSVIDGWYMQSSTEVSSDLTSVAQPGFDTSSWYRVGSHETVMVGILSQSGCAVLPPY